MSGVTDLVTVRFTVFVGGEHPKACFRLVCSIGSLLYTHVLRVVLTREETIIRI